MRLLKPLPANQPIEEIEQGSDSPPQQCEICKTVFPRHKMINLFIGISSPGNERLSGGIGCSYEHWACSPNCWQKLAHACIDEHVVYLLLEARKKVGIKE